MELKQIQEKWDLVVIGGGITGAGILREAVRMGYQVLLVEQEDFAWGTSSRSSKMVHGGLRYLKEGKVFLTRASVKERERLIQEASDLVEPLDFLMPVYQDRGPSKWMLASGLSLYSILAGKRQHRFYKRERFLELAPLVNQEKLIGGFRFIDAQVDDVRLVLRVIQEACAVSKDSKAFNYTKVIKIERDEEGNVNGVILRDVETQEIRTIKTRTVINATGSWAETLHPSPDSKTHIRPLRGSHLIFPQTVIPVKEVVSFVHPQDERPVFACPWEGAVLFGTTDFDHREDLNLEPSITPKEIDYLMEAVHYVFPGLKISLEDCIATIAGVRPVLSEGKVAPSQESRKHLVWVDKGLVTITGGKLTTFRRLALDTLEKARTFLPPSKKEIKDDRIFATIPDIAEENTKISHEQLKRLYGRYGAAAKKLIEKANPLDLEIIPGTYTLWAELPFVARESVKHLSDLLLRRVRIGILTPQGGKEYLDRIQQLCAPVLLWDEEKWKKEIAEYLELWKSSYAPPV